MAFDLGKYYTPKYLAKYAIDTFDEVVGLDKVSRFIESSAGSGAFLDILDDLGYEYLAFDIVPEDSKNRITKADYLNTRIDYKRGTCHIGNPPYSHGSEKGNVGRKGVVRDFLNKYTFECDYICVILPDNYYKQDNIIDAKLLYTEHLGKEHFKCKSGTCLNIYRVIGGHNRGNKDLSLYNVEIKSIENYGLNETGKYDLIIRKWAHNTRLGEPCKLGDYSSCFGIKIMCDNKEHIINKYKEKYKDYFTSVYLTSHRAYNTNKQEVYKFFRKCIPEALTEDEIEENDILLKEDFIVG